MFFFNYNNIEKYAKGGKLTSKYNYIRNADIESVEVNKRGKTIEIDGADIIDGLYVKKGKYAKGGKTLDIDEDTFSNVFTAFGFVPRKSFAGVKFYVNKKHKVDGKIIYGSVDLKNKRVIVENEDSKTYYDSFSISELINTLEKLGFDKQYAKGGEVGFNVGDWVYVISYNPEEPNFYGEIVEIGSKMSKVEIGDGEIVTVMNAQIQKEQYAKGGEVGEGIQWWEVKLKMPNGKVVYTDVIADNKEDAEYYGELSDYGNAGGEVLSVKYVGMEEYAKGGGVVDLKKQIDALYSKSNFINTHFNWKLKLLEMLQDQSVEAYQIYTKLTKKQKDDVLQELFEIDNDMGSDGDGEIETTKENLNILLEDAKNGNKYADGGEIDDIPNSYKNEFNELKNTYGEHIVMLYYPDGVSSYYNSRTKGNYSLDAIKQQLKYTTSK